MTAMVSTAILTPNAHHVGVGTHARYRGGCMREVWSRETEMIPSAVDVNRFAPGAGGSCVGGITSYYANKGVDLLLLAWAGIESQFPQHRLRVYGAGSDR